MSFGIITGRLAANYFQPANTKDKEVNEYAGPVLDQARLVGLIPHLILCINISVSAQARVPVL